MYKRTDKGLLFFIVHPGGPFWKNKDAGAWSIPKGEVKEGEELIDCAIREMREETGINAAGSFIELGTVKLKSGKIIHAWAFEGDWNGLLQSHYTKVEWPISSGKIISVPEVDKAGFYTALEAKKRLNPAQAAFIDGLLEQIPNL